MLTVLKAHAFTGMWVFCSQSCPFFCCPSTSTVANLFLLVFSSHVSFTFIMFHNSLCLKYFSFLMCTVINKYFWICSLLHTPSFDDVLSVHLIFPNLLKPHIPNVSVCFYLTIYIHVVYCPGLCNRVQKTYHLVKLSCRSKEMGLDGCTFAFVQTVFAIEILAFLPGLSLHWCYCYPKFFF